MASHVFIVRSDIRYLGCDAWLLPCGSRGRPAQEWIPRHLRSFDKWPERPADFTSTGLRVLEVTAWPSDEPRPWLVNVGGRAGQDVSWFVHGLQQALDAVLPTLSGRPGRFGRPKPLLATPLLGTGRGGFFAQAGDAVKAMLPLLYEAAKK